MDKEDIPVFSKLSPSSRLGFLFKDSIIYGGAAALGKAFSLITFPILARSFSVVEYGVLDYFMVLANFFAIFFIFGQDSAVARYFYEDEDFGQRQQLISQSLFFQFTILIIFLPVLWFSAPFLTGYLIESPDRLILFRLVLSQLPFLILINFSQGLLKWTFSRSPFLIISVGFVAVQSVVLLILVSIIIDISIESILIVNFVVSVIFSFLGLFFIRRWITKPKNFLRLREIFPFAVPYGVICVIGVFSPILERTLTNHLLGSEDMGLYAVATKLAMLIGLLASAFQTAWGPFSLTLYKEDNAINTYNRVLKLFALILCLAVLILMLLAQPMIYLLATDKYNGAIVLVFPLAFGLAIQATSWITEVGVVFSKRSHFNLYAYLSFIATTLLGIWFLIPMYGLFGAGLGVLFGYLSKAVIASWLAQRVYPLPWQYRSVFLLMGTTLVLGLLSTWFGQQFDFFSRNILLLISLIFIFFLGWGVVFDKQDRKRIVSSIKIYIGKLYGA